MTSYSSSVIEKTDVLEIHEKRYKSAINQSDNLNYSIT